MSRRLLIGNDGQGGFRIRQAKPGFDALGTSLDGRVFDADFVPGRVIGTGAFQVVPGAIGQLHNAVQPHGLGKAPDMLIATGQPLNSSGAAVNWPIWFQTTGGSPGITDLGNSNMDARAVTPFVFSSTYSGVTGGSEVGGWYYQFDATNITAFFYANASYRLLVRWTALEL